MKCPQHQGRGRPPKDCPECQKANGVRTPRQARTTLTRRAEGPPENNVTRSRGAALPAPVFISAKEIEAMHREDDLIYHKDQDAGFPCRVCGQSWTGYARSHCSGCHLTFSSVGMFDRHRRNFECMDPEKVVDKHGNHLFVLDDGVWRGPDLPEGVFGAKSEPKAHDDYFHITFL